MGTVERDERKQEERERWGMTSNKSPQARLEPETLWFLMSWSTRAPLVVYNLTERLSAALWVEKILRLLEV